MDLWEWDGMTQQGRRKRARSSPRPRPAASGARRWERTWHRLVGFLTNTKNAVLTLGGLAAAVSAILVLAHSHPPPALKVDFDRLKVDDGMSLDEFDKIVEAQPTTLAGLPIQRDDPQDRRLAYVAHPSPTIFADPHRLTRLTRPAPSAGSSSSTGATTPSIAEVAYSRPGGEPSSTFTSTSAETSAEVTVTSSAEDTSTEDSSTEATGLSTTEDGTIDGAKLGSSGKSTSALVIPRPATPFTSVGGVPTREGTGASPAQVHEVAEALSKMHSSRRPRLALPPKCESSTCPATRSLFEHALAYYPNAVVAAREVSRAFADSRGQVIDHRFHPVGATVLYTVDLVGFAHQEAILVWSLWSRGASRPLPRTWLQHVITREVEPQREDVTVPGRFWVPVPAQPGEYEVHLTVYTSNDVERGEMETEPFH